MTTYDRTGVQRVRAAVESSFGTDMTTDVATNFFDLRVAEHCEIMRGTVVGDDTSIVQRAWQQNAIVISEIDRWTATVKCQWTGSGQSLDASTSPTKTAQTKFLEQVLGGYAADQGSGVAASPSPTTTGFTVTGGHGSRFLEGQLIGIKLGGGSTTYVRMVTAISTDALTIWPALPSAPSTGDDVLNGQNLYLTDAPSGSLNLLVEAATDRGNIYLGTGGQGTFALDATRGSIITWSCELAGAKYIHDDEFATPIGGGAISAATFTGGSPIHSMNGLLHFAPTSSSTLTSIRDAGFSLNANLANEEVNEFNGIDGLGQYQRNTRNAQTIELTIPGAHETYQDAFLAATNYGLLFQAHSTSGQLLGFAAPTCQIAAPPEPVAIGSMRGAKLTLRILENSKCSDKSTELRRAPWVLAAI